jgi:hypothetical protein
MINAWGRNVGVIMAVTKYEIWGTDLQTDLNVF